MKSPLSFSQFARIFVTAAAIAGGAMGCGSKGDTMSNGPCDATPIFTKHTCTVVGACHDGMGSAAGFDMLTPGWETHLVGVASAGGGAGTLASLCKGMVYLNKGTVPATGLFIDKLTKNPPPCGVAMPNLPPLLNATEKACVQSWADHLVMTTP
jgi:hypothetical protein